ncbi:MAG: flagellar biosynthesis anti-sigma factor FlgM [Proteobacteria bacterium]|nr:MAG: flagellar biosynthesis anti-sigma factor FlgM [Pseudomonadota bacterium]
MDSKKIGPNVSTGLANTGSVAKTKGVQQESDAKKVKEKSADPDYNVNLSGQAKDMAEARLKAMDIARNTPDVREDKIAELKAKIQSGEYKVSAENIADGMLREAVKDELSKGKPELS